jgi:hypothetical protein
MKRWGHTLLAFAISLPGAALLSQTPARAASPFAAAPVPPAVIRPSAASGASRTFHDPSYKVSFDYPSNWTFTRNDREISTFHLDARSAPRKTRLRAVAAIPENPFPESTFEGAYVYLSVTPHSNPEACAIQAAPPRPRPAPAGTPAGTPSRPLLKPSARPVTKEIGGIAFAHGHDEQKHICTTDRDEIYTTLHKGSCYRFDLAINNFCGGEVSGVRDITPQQLDEVRQRMEAILSTVRFDPR